ncbi:hypothetical protein SLA2020_469420 [Shorea laevis]
MLNIPSVPIIILFISVYPPLLILSSYTDSIYKFDQEKSKHSTGASTTVLNPDNVIRKQQLQENPLQFI